MKTQNSKLKKGCSSANSKRPAANCYLLIDTSTPLIQIALADRDIIFAKEELGSEKLSKDLLPHIEKILHENELKPEKLIGIIAYLGPGSYTALRIGITIANTFSYSLDIPIAGIQGEDPGKEKFDLKTMEPFDLNLLLKEGLKILNNSERNISLISPFYGKKPNVS